MKVYQVEYCHNYPDSDKRIRIAHVIAKDFEEAVKKVEQRFKQEFESATVHKISLEEESVIII